MPDDRQRTLGKLMDDIRFAMLTTVDAGGRLVSRPMTLQDRDDDWTLYFVTQRGNPVAGQSDGRQLNLAFAGDGAYVSVSGTGSVVNDEEKKRELWDAFNEAYTDGGPENPDNVILAVDAESAEYWDTPSGPATLLGVLKAVVAGGRPPAGENETVEL